MVKKTRSVLSLSTLLIGAFGVYGCKSNVAKETVAKPNIIVILADDLGYSDLGCYGGEVQTPNLDALAADGVRFTRFYNAGRSCPTRASLLTGLYPHQAGIGRMTFDQKQPGYRGTITSDGVTIAEALQQAGYSTAMVGKWHVSETPLQPDQRQWLAHQVEYPTFADINTYPTRRGFEQFYGCIYGVVDYFDPFSLVNGETPVASVPKDYYATNAFTDTAVAYVSRFATDNKPFFLYLSYTAPHWPLHALAEDIQKYENVYKVGWEQIRANRYERMRKLKLFENEADYLSARQFDDQWSVNPDADWDAHAMAVHAAMVDRMDQGIGKLIAELKASGQYDNTLILFLSDNGCSPEDCQLYAPGENDRPDLTRTGEQIHYPIKKDVLPGPETSFASVGPKWANVLNTPFRYWKAKTYEGGICTPMIAHWPAGIKTEKGQTTSQLGHIIDLMATCLDISGAQYPATYNGHTIIPMEGKSLDPIFKTGTREGHVFLGFEHFGEKALIRADGWKLIQPGNNKPWELYDLNTDRSEMRNIAADHQDQVAKMESDYQVWANRTMVYPAP